MKYNPIYRIAIARSNKPNDFILLPTIYHDLDKAKAAAADWMTKNWKSGYIATARPMI